MEFLAHHEYKTCNCRLASSCAVSTGITASLSPAFAGVGLANKNPDFDITNVSGFTMTVAGTATPPDQRHVYAYVFVLNTCSTDLCAYAVTSHRPHDSTDVTNDIDWHTHYVELTAGENGLCVSTISGGVGSLLTLSGHTVTANGASGTVVAGLTAVLNIDLDAGVCVQKVIDFQSA